MSHILKPATLLGKNPLEDKNKSQEPASFVEFACFNDNSLNYGCIR
jgi:hypothetical protein